MMSVTIAPSETRSAHHIPAGATRALARPLLLAALGGIGLVAFSVGAYSMLGQLAGPQIAKTPIGRQASQWPDLKDGVPVIAPARGEPVRAEPARVAPTPPPPLPQAATASPAPSRRALPPIEVAAMVEAGGSAPLVTTARTAALVAPGPGQTVRARSAETTFAALPPAEPATAATARPARKPAERAKPAPGAVAAEAAPAPAPAPVVAEPEETEVLGVKIPSLAASGRRLMEGVQSLGDAVAGQF